MAALAWNRGDSLRWTTVRELESKLDEVRNSWADRKSAWQDFSWRDHAPPRGPGETTTSPDALFADAAEPSTGSNPVFSRNLPLGLASKLPNKEK